jgi:O-antigen/teichoic acid export membrane protein
MTEPYSGSKTRRNLISFLIGKVPNALATAGLLALLARALSSVDLGHYIVGMAVIELALGLSTLGIDWVLLRFVPEYRVNGSRRELIVLVLKALAARFCVLLLVATVLLGGATLIMGGMADFPMELALPLVLLLVAEGLNRIVRDNCFEALAMQTSLQLCTLLRSMLMIAALLTMGNASARFALYGELAASLFSLLLGGILLVRALSHLPAAGKEEWQRPHFRQMASVALNNYANGIAEYVYSTSFLILVLSRFQPAGTVAGLGFVLRLVDIIRNYMPGMVIFSVVRSRMIGAYAINRSYVELQAWASFVYKISVLTLLPVFAIAILYGDLVLQLSSGGRFGEFHMLFAVLCGWLALRLHRLILNVVCNAVGLMAMWARAASCSLIVLPVLLACGIQSQGTWIVPLALIGSELIINILVVRGMRVRGRYWPIGTGWWARAILAAAVACALVMALPVKGNVALFLHMAVLCVVYGISVLIAGTIDSNDKQLINRVAGRQVFRATPSLS